MKENRGDVKSPQFTKMQVMKPLTLLGPSPKYRKKGDCLGWATVFAAGSYKAGLLGSTPSHPTVCVRVLTL